MPSAARLLRGPARAARITREVRSAARRHDAPTHAVARRAASLVSRGFTMREARLFGLLDPAMPIAEVDRHVSRRAAYALQDRLNPEPFRPLAEDKALFARVCRWQGLPVPRVLALVYRDAAGWTPEGDAPFGEVEWRAVIEARLPQEFVVKPAWGHLGKGVRVLRRDGAGFREEGGGALDSGAVWRILAADPDWPAFIVQERLRNHPELRDLSGTDAVQTVRAITLLDRRGRARVLWADLRIVMGDAMVDNWRDGTTGNALAAVDLASGRLGSAVGPAPDGGTRRHEAHPRTGRRFDDVCLPHWPRVLALLEEAAPAFAPMRALGWDVVIGADGPVLLETQARWGPHNQSRAMPAIMRAMRDALP